MENRTIAITGATSGIGEVAAIHLAQAGARIVFTAREQSRADVTLEKLRRANPAAAHRVLIGDLSLLADMKRVGHEIAAEPRIDVLINNAGALFNRREETPDGLERTFALNHMSYFVITTILLPHLQPGARIVSTASGAHRGASLDFDDLQSAKSYRGFGVYSRSKLMNILFTRELARRLPLLRSMAGGGAVAGSGASEGGGGKKEARSGVTANCLHPGFVATRFGDQSGGVMQRVMGVAKPVGAISPEEGAKTIIYLAASPDVENVSGEYFYKCKIEAPTAEARNDADAKRLWETSEKIAA